MDGAATGMRVGAVSNRDMDGCCRWKSCQRHMHESGSTESLVIATERHTGSEAVRMGAVLI